MKDISLGQSQIVVVEFE